VWTGPIQIVAICALLIAQLGPSALAGIGLLVILTPIQAILYKKLATVRKIVAPIADKRIKASQEVFQGIRVIKLFGWESAFLSQIEKLRESEIKQLLKKSILSAFVMAIVFAVPGNYLMQLYY